MTDRFGGWNAAKRSAGLATIEKGSHDAAETVAVELALAFETSEQTIRAVLDEA